MRMILSCDIKAYGSIEGKHSEFLNIENTWKTHWKGSLASKTEYKRLAHYFTKKQTFPLISISVKSNKLQ